MFRRKWFYLAGLALCLAFSGSQLVRAQQTGTLSGTVSDSTGALIPKATVTIVNEQTSLTRTVHADDTGFFTAPDLPVGSYTVSASASGFKVATNTGIDLHVAEQKTVPIVLQVGVQTETVTVEGRATQVELRSGAVSSLIGKTQMSELPLNGRSFVQLTLLVPGASVGDNVSTRNTGLLAGVDISMSGNGANTNSWLVDGVDNVDHGSGRTILVYPSIDSIEEFKVQRNSYGAESPAAGGAQINVVTKSGSNRFHGSVYEFFRNDKLDATNFFLNSAGQKKGELRYNDWGYTIGGPIKKDKVFFFFSEEWRREIRGITRQFTVPTAAEKTGNFSGTLSGNDSLPTDPYTGNPFPGNQMPQCATGSNLSAAGGGCLSVAGLAFAQIYPDPNTTGRTINNWVAAVPTAIPTRQEQIRADFNINAKTTAMFRYTQDAWANPAPNIGGNGGLWGDTGFPTVDSSWQQPGKNMGGRVTTTFGPSMINDFQFSYSNNRIIITEGIGKSINAAIVGAIPTVYPAPADRTHPIFWGAGPGSTSLWNIAPWKNQMDLYVWQDDFTKIHANHTLKFGGLFSTNTKREIGCCGNQGLQFWGPNAVPGHAGKGGGWGDNNAPGNGGSVTGNKMADLLLRNAYFGGSEASFLPLFKPDWKNYEFYGTDTFRVTSRLTLDFGARWSFLPPEVQDDGLVGNFVPSLYDPSTAATNQLDGMIFPTNYTNSSAGITGGAANLHGLNIGNALMYKHNDLIAPRFGFAYDPTGKGKWAIRGGVGSFFGRADLSHPLAELVTNPPFTLNVSWGSGRPLDYVPGAIPTAGSGSAANAADISAKVEGSYQWNFTIERELARDTKLEVSYIGNRGHHLPYNYNLNDVPQQFAAQWAYLNFTPNQNTTTRDKLRPLYALKGTNGITYQTYGGNSTYHSAQFFLTKRFSNNYSLQAAYTYSKLLSDTSLTCCGGGNGGKIDIPNNPRYNRGPADFDRTHIFTFNGIYRLPSMNDKAWLQRGVIGGWEATTIYSFSSGIPLTPQMNSSLVGIDGNASMRPDCAYSGHVAPGSYNADQWINEADFILPVQLGRLGYCPKGVARAPALNNMDFAVYKNFAVHKWEGSYIQLRFETFNTLNHTQLQNIDMGMTLGGQTTVNPVTKVASTTSFQACNTLGTNTFPNCNINPTFGKPTGAREPREIQLALKFVF